VAENSPRLQHQSDIESTERAIETESAAAPVERHLDVLEEGVGLVSAPTTYSSFTYTLDPVGIPSRIVTPPIWNAACRLAHRAADSARGRSLWSREDAATLGIDGLRA
jgi:hypothetical protein